jgi:hypothetical protein
MTEEKAKTQKTKAYFSYKAGMRLSYLSPVKLRIQNIML